MSLRQIHMLLGFDDAYMKLLFPFAVPSLVSLHIMFPFFSCFLFFFFTLFFYFIKRLLIKYNLMKAISLYGVPSLKKEAIFSRMAHLPKLSFFLWFCRSVPSLLHVAKYISEITLIFSLNVGVVCWVMTARSFCSSSKIREENGWRLLELKNFIHPILKIKSLETLQSEQKSWHGKKLLVWSLE